MMSTAGLILAESRNDSPSVRKVRIGAPHLRHGLMRLVADRHDVGGGLPNFCDGFDGPRSIKTSLGAVAFGCGAEQARPEGFPTAGTISVGSAGDLLIWINARLERPVGGQTRNI
jgi:hypothetical protein